jgi:hypothetical protein
MKLMTIFFQTILCGGLLWQTGAASSQAIQPIQPGLQSWSPDSRQLAFVSYRLINP